MALKNARSTTLTVQLVLIVFAVLADGIAAKGAAATKTAWKFGDRVPVTCLNRTIDTGEHVTDPHGNLQYIPSLTCAETKSVLSLPYFSSMPFNCSFTLTDPMFHLLEFYIHNDVPLTCRIPTSPSTHGLSEEAISGEDKKGAIGSESSSFTPLVVSLSGTLQLSHLHVANRLNFLMHTSPLAKHLSKREQAVLGATNKDETADPGAIISAAAYSVSPATQNTRIVIGDTLTLQIHPRWYVGGLLPPSSSSSSSPPYTAVSTRHHNLWSTLIYCLISAAASATICTVYFRGIDLPRRLRFHGSNRIGGWSGKRQELPVYKGYGYGVGVPAASNGNGSAYGNGYGYSIGTTGKRD